MGRPRRPIRLNPPELAAREPEYLRVMYDALVRIERIMREHGTDDERREDRRLFELAQAASDDDRPSLLEQQEVLFRTIEVRGEAYTAYQRGDYALANEIQVDHRQWIRRMRATRLALEAAGLHHGQARVHGHEINVFIQAASVAAVDAMKPAFMHALRRELRPPTEKVRFTIVVQTSPNRSGESPT